MPQAHTFRLVVLAGLLAATHFASATSGGVDANGCHNSKKVGYHCHAERAKKGATAKSERHQLPYASETMRQRQDRMARECAGLPNAGACRGYGN